MTLSLIIHALNKRRSLFKEALLSFTIFLSETLKKSLYGIYVQNKTPN